MQRTHTLNAQLYIGKRIYSELCTLAVLSAASIDRTMAHVLAAGVAGLALMPSSSRSVAIRSRVLPKIAPAPVHLAAFGNRCSERFRQLPHAVRADQQTETLDPAVLQAISSITAAVDQAISSTLAASAQAAQTVQAATDSELRGKVVNAVKKLQTGLLERETEASLPPSEWLTEFMSEWLINLCGCC